MAITPEITLPMITPAILSEIPSKMYPAVSPIASNKIPDAHATVHECSMSSFLTT